MTSIIEYAFFITEPTRYRIIHELMTGPLFLSDLEKKLDISREAMHFHLLKLIEYGFLVSELRICKVPTSCVKGKAQSMYSLTGLYEKLLPEIRALF